MEIELWVAYEWFPKLSGDRVPFLTERLLRLSDFADTKSL